jgi:RHS repeat-associated protein
MGGSGRSRRMVSLLLLVALVLPTLPAGAAVPRASAAQAEPADPPAGPGASAAGPPHGAGPDALPPPTWVPARPDPPPPPLPAAPTPASAGRRRESAEDVDPTQRHRVAAPDGRLAVELPPGAAAEPLRVAIDEELDRPARKRHVLRAFQLKAEARRGGRRVAKFDRELTLTYRYEDAELAGRDPRSLRFAYRDEATGQWRYVRTALDQANRTISATTSHFSYWFVTTTDSNVEMMPRSALDDLRLDLFSGAATLAYPLEVPPGPGGLEPRLVLTYNSHASFANQRSNYISGKFGGVGYQSASPYGEGFELELGKIDVQRPTGDPASEKYHLSLLGRTDLLVEVGRDAAYRHYKTFDEQFYRIRRDNYDIWGVTTPDGTVYEFGQGEARRIHSEEINGGWTTRTNRYLLSRVVDTHGNAIDYSYYRPISYVPSGCPGAWEPYSPYVSPLQISYAGGDVTIRFWGVDGRADAPWASGHEGCEQLFYDPGAITSIDMYVDRHTSSRFVRRYILRYNSVADDRPLRLSRLELSGDVTDRNVQPLLLFGYYPRGRLTCLIAECGAGGTDVYYLLGSVTNGRGGTVEFDYADATAAGYLDRWNGRPYTITFARVVERTLSAGPSSPTRIETYAYAGARGNSNLDDPRFHGHALVVVSTAGRRVDHYFLQGFGDETLLSGDTIVDSYAALTGLVWRRVVFDGGTVLRVDESQLDVVSGYDPYTPGTVWPQVQQVRELRRWRYDYPRGALAIEHPGRLAARAEITPWHFGNALWVDEYDNLGLLHGKTYTFFNTNRERWINDRVAVAARHDPALGVIEATWFGYDGHLDVQHGPSGVGDLTLVRRQVQILEDHTGRAGVTSDTGYEYDPAGNVSATRAYNAAGYVHETYFPRLQTASAAGFGVPPARTHVSYDRGTFPSTVTHPLHGEETFVYDRGFGAPRSHTDANGAVTTHEYDVFGRLVKTFLPGDQGAATVEYEHDDASTPRRLTVRRRTDAGGWATSPGRDETHRYFDGFGRPIQEKVRAENGQWIETSRLYDEHGRVTREAPPTFRQTGSFVPTPWWTMAYTARSYDALDRPTAVVTPDGARTEYSYDGYTSWVVDPNGRCRSSQRDAFERTVLVREFDGATAHGVWPITCGNAVATAYRYDALDRLVAVDDSSGSGVQTRVAYDGLGRRTSVDDPDLGRWRYAHDARGNLRRATDARGVALMQRFDSEDRLVGRGAALEALSAAEIVRLRREVDRQRGLFGRGPYAWVDSNLLAGGAIRAIHFQNLRDALRQIPGRGRLQFAAGQPVAGQPVRASDVDDVRRWLYGDETYGRAFAASDLFTYDDTAGGNQGRGRRTGMRRADGDFAASFTYDERGRLTRDARTIGGALYETGYSYDAHDRLVGQTYPRWNPADPSEPRETIAHGYNDRSLLRLLHWYVPSITYDARGQPGVMTSAVGVETHRTYEPRSARLVALDLRRAGAPLLRLSYGYDAAGNLTSQSEDGASTQFSYDHLHRLTGAAGAIPTSYAYDPVGNLTAKTEAGQTVALTYSPSTRPRHAPRSVGGLARTYDANGNLLSDGARAYTYDDANRLVTVTVAGATTRFSYDPDGVRYKKVAAGQTTVYVGNHYERNTTTGIVSATYWGAGLPLAVRRGPPSGAYEVVYPHHDRLGSAIAATSSTQPDALTAYWPYGTQRAPALPGLDRLFTSQRAEPNLGLYDYGARFYDPTAGRFLQPDPLVANLFNPQDLNAYSYARNNPLLYTDPNGLFCVPCVVGVAMVVGGALVSPSIVNAPAPGDALVPSDPFAPLRGSLAWGPGTGDLNDIGSAVAGYDLLSGEHLNSRDRVLTAVAAFFPGVNSRTMRLSVPELGSGRAYSVAFEAQLPEQFWKADRSRHKREANRLLHEAIEADPAFHQGLNRIIPDVRGWTMGTGLPPRWTWHHHEDLPGVMQLVPRVQHQASGVWQRLFHTSGSGGYVNWGR